MIIHQLLLTVYKNNFILSVRCGIYIIYMIKNHAYKVFLIYLCFIEFKCDDTNNCIELLHTLYNLDGMGQVSLA